MLGEGDGRFLRAFVRQNPHAHIDYLDASRAMLDLAWQRVARAERRTANVRFLQSDVLKTLLPDCSYDLAVTHFFLDCFNEYETRQIVSTIGSAMLADARWLISEFHQPMRGIWKYVSLCILWVTYLFFRWTTGLERRSLPDYRSALSSNGFSLECERLFMKGMLVSELWRRRTSAGPR